MTCGVYTQNCGVGEYEVWECRSVGVLGRNWESLPNALGTGYCWGFGIGIGCGIGWANCTLFVCLSVRALNW